jgi:hypothetical protein
MSIENVNTTVCGTGTVPVNCNCDPGVDGMVRYCGPNPGGRRCSMTLYCFHDSECEDAVVTGSCAPL